MIGLGELYLKGTKDIDGLDPHARPRYSLAQAARYVRISPTTLRSWVMGRTYPTASGSRYFEPLILRPVPEDPRLSFSNLVEAHVLRSLRTRHEVPGLLQVHLQRIERDIQGVAVRLFPVIDPHALAGPKIVGIDPKVSFGHPHIMGKGVRTSTIVERLDAGESREALTADYQLEDAEIEEALLYERAA